MGAQIYPTEQLIELNLQYKIMNRLIRGAATNINQLTRIANTTSAVPAAKLLIDMYQDIRIIKDNLQPLWEETRRMVWQS
jgi:nucleoside permease NupC